jgi:hypothetical protein
MTWQGAYKLQLWNSNCTDKRRRYSFIKCLGLSNKRNKFASFKYRGKMDSLGSFLRLAANFPLQACFVYFSYYSWMKQFLWGSRRDLRPTKPPMGRSQWPCGLRRGSSAARLLRSWVWMPPRAWMSVCCECCVLLGRGLCDGLITRPEESYRLWCVSNVLWSWSLEKWGGLGPLGAVEPLGKKKYINRWFWITCFVLLTDSTGQKTS